MGIDYTTCAPVVPGNQPPIANAGSDQILKLPVNNTILYGSQMDVDGPIWYTRWTKISGPASHTIVSPVQPYSILRDLAEGVYQFELRLTDDKGGIDRDTVMITVMAAAPNNVPVVNAGENKSITLPVNSVQLNGSATDSDGTIITYQWNKISGPSQFIIQTSNQAQTNITDLLVGTYSFELVVTDNAGGVGRDTVTVTVNAGVNIPPVANAGPDQSINLPTNSLTLNGRATDADGTIISYKWSKITGPAQFNIVSATNAVSVINNLLEGVYTFELEATDNSGATDKDTVSITVNPAPNIPPTANAGPDINIALPNTNVTLNGSGSDPDGTISSYQWTKLTGPAQYDIVSSNQAQTSVNNLVEGVYTFELKVTDDKGASDADTMRVIVNPLVPNLPPVADAGKDTVVNMPDNSAVLQGGGFDPDGFIVNYRWAKIAGPAQFSFTNRLGANATVQEMAPGIYFYELEVTDNRGAIAKDTIQVTVKERTISIASAYPNPATDIINLKIEAKTNANMTTLAIFDINGRIVHQETFMRSHAVFIKQLDISNLPKGSYLIEVGADINNKVNVKFIKQ
jgi:hypothetical protein